MRGTAIFIGLFLLVTGCTSEPPAPAPWTPVPHPPAPRAPDRDVLHTLATIDPCALVGQPDDRLRRPHMCIARPSDGAEATVAIDDRTDHAKRFTLPVKEIDGVKVYVVRTNDGSCELEVPVSFTYAVTIDALPGPSPDECGMADKLAAKVIAGLAHPDEVRHRADMPDLGKDACTVLSAVTGDEPPGHALGRSTIDDCNGAVPGLGGTRIAMLVEPGPPEGGWGTKWATVDGKDIYLADQGCQWTWSQGHHSGDDNRLITVVADRCKAPSDATVKTVLGKLIKALAKPPAAGAAERLTYRADEPDEPNPGACVDHPSDRCEPYQPTPLPEGAAQLAAVARTDPHVTCAATLDAVRARFPGLRPVVDPDQRACSYVEPSHALQLDIGAQDVQNTAVDGGVERPVTIAGHQGVYQDNFAEDEAPMASVCVDSGHDRVFWCVTATFRPPRDDPAAKPDTRGAATLEQLLADPHLTG